MKKKADKTDESRPEKKSAARLLGSLVGAGAALPAATGVFIAAGLAGVPVGTAVTRTVLVALAVWIVAGLAARILFSLLIRDWRRTADSVGRKGAGE